MNKPALTQALLSAIPAIAAGIYIHLTHSTNHLDWLALGGLSAIPLVLLLAGRRQPGAMPADLPPVAIADDLLAALLAYTDSEYDDLSMIPQKYSSHPLVLAIQGCRARHATLIRSQEQDTQENKHEQTSHP